MCSASSTSPTWGIVNNQKFRSNARGNIIDQILSLSNDLNLFNTLQTLTHLNNTTGSLSAIDLTLGSITISPKLTWSTHSDLCDSDHFPILLSIDTPPPTYKSAPRWKTQEADWSKFYELSSHTDVLPDPNNLNTSLPKFTTFIIEAAQASIPRTSGLHKPGQVHWWSEEINTAIKARRKAYRTYQLSHSQEDLITYKRLRTKTRLFIRSAKKDS